MTRVAIRQRFFGLTEVLCMPDRRILPEGSFRKNASNETSASGAVTRELHGSHAQFLIRKKTFAYFSMTIMGNDIVAVTCKVLPGENEREVKAHPRRFYLPAYIASRGWVELRLDTGKVD